MRFVALFDIHYGQERAASGRLHPIHNTRALAPIFKFLDDFQPEAFIFGGDQIDFGEISHWNKHRRMSLEGLRLIDSIHGFKRDILDRVDRLLPANATKIFHIGNHTDWLFDLLEENPALAGLIDLDRELQLTARDWRIIPLDGVSRLGKLYFAHGHQIKGGEYPSKAAVLHFERNIAFGHHHTYQIYTKTSAIDATEVKAGIAVPCLCRRDLRYGEGKPNRWSNGFLWGIVQPNGHFTAQVTLIDRGRFYANGKLYVA